MITYGQSISWTSRNGSWSEVTVNGRSSSEEALRDALEQAKLFGYTPPKWWQWWRWKDKNYGVEVVERQKL